MSISKDLWSWTLFGFAFNVILCCAHTFFFYNVPSPSKSHFSNFPFLMKMTVVRGARERKRGLHAKFFYRFPLILLSCKPQKIKEIKIPNESLWHFISLWQLEGLMVIPQFFQIKQSKRERQKKQQACKKALRMIFKWQERNEIPFGIRNN